MWFRRLHGGKLHGKIGVYRLAMMIRRARYILHCSLLSPASAMNWHGVCTDGVYTDEVVMSGHGRRSHGVCTDRRPAVHYL